jgi:hypothetical protein
MQDMKDEFNKDIEILKKLKLEFWKWKLNKPDKNLR